MTLANRKAAYKNFRDSGQDSHAEKLLKNKPELAELDKKPEEKPKGKKKDAKK